MWPTLQQRLEIGLNHEQQHQELLLTDIKLNFSANPLRPAYRDDLSETPHAAAPPLHWIAFPGASTRSAIRAAALPTTTKSPATGSI